MSDEREYGIYKRELIALVAERTGKSKKDVKEVIEAMLDEVSYQLESGQKVCLTSFGTFDTPYREGRVMWHPSGKFITVPKRKRIRFRPGKWLLARVRR